MKNILTFLSAFFLLTVGYAQTNNQMVSPSDSDPEAKLLLDKMRNKYQNYRSIQANFDLALAFPNQPVENQKIEILQSAEKYRLEMPGRTIISDGVSIWMILHRNKEVQINTTLVYDFYCDYVSTKPELEYHNIAPPQHGDVYLDTDDFTWWYGDGFSGG